jgi:predicted DNA-binding protein
MCCRVDTFGLFLYDFDMSRPKLSIERIQTGLRLKKDLYRKLQHLAIDLEIPLNTIVEDAIEEYLQKPRHRSLQKLLRELESKHPEEPQGQK